MDKKTSKLNRAVVLGVTLLVLVVPFCLYYVVYVSSQRTYFTQKSHRALEGVGSQIISRIDNIRKVVENTARKGCQADAEKLQELSDKDFMELNPYGAKLVFRRADEQPPQRPRSDARVEAPVFSGDAITVDFRQDGSTNMFVLNYTRGRESTSRQASFSVTSVTRELFTPVVDRFVIHDRQAAGEDLFDKVFVADSTSGTVIFEYGLEAIAVANIDDLLSASAAAAESRQGADKQKEPASPEQGPETRPSDAAQPRPAERRRATGRGGSELVERKIADADYKLFLRPIQLTTPQTGSNARRGLNLIVGGLVRSEHLNAKTYSFSYTLLLLLILIVLITVLSAPLIKLRLLGLKDRLRGSDVLLTVCSAFFGAALLTLTLLDGYTYTKMEKDLDGQLADLASTVDGNLRSEIVSAAAQIDSLSDKLGENLLNLNLDSEEVCPNGLNSCGAGKGESAQTARGARYFKDNILRGDGLLDPESADYPYFNSVQWMDSTGQQQIKFTTRRNHPAFVCVDDRPYFNNAKEGRLWEVAWNISEKDRRKESVYVEALNSKASGENVAVISKKTRDKDYVAALDTKLLSLYQTVLPAGYGFCVLDRSGLVLFHTDDVKNLEENFFEECNNDRRLRAAVQSHQGDWMDLQYLGRAHRAFVQPIPGLPWSLVVFRDKQILRTINLEMMTLVAILFGAYTLLLAATLLLFAALSFFFLPRSRLRLANIWPNPENGDRYKRIAIVNAVLFAVFLILIMASGRGVLILWGLLFPALALAFSVRSMTKKERARSTANETAPVQEGGAESPGEPSAKQVKKERLDWRSWYCLALSSLLAAACIAPAMAFFKAMRDEQVRVFIRYGQMSLARGLERREDQVRNQYASVDPRVDAGLKADQLVKKRLESDLDVYAFFFFDTKRIDRPAQNSQPIGGPLGWFLTHFNAFYNETCVDSLDLVRRTSADKRWESSEDANTLTFTQHSMAAEVDASGQAEPVNSGAGINPSAAGAQPDGKALPSWTLATPQPGFMNLTDPLLWSVLLLGLGLLIGTYFAVRFAARRLLLLDMETPRASRIPLGAPVEENYLVVSPPLFDGGNRFPADKFFRIDLSSIATDEQWEKESSLDAFPKNLPVVIDRFEFKRDDAEWNERKLGLVSRLVFNKERRVVIVSSVDPMGFGLPPAAKEAAKAAKNGDQAAGNEKPRAFANASSANGSLSSYEAGVERWSATLASFVRVDTFDRADPASCGDLIGKVGASRPWSYLQSIKNRIDFDNAEGEELIAEVGDQAEAYYRAVWSACSREQRLTLCRVAQDGLVTRLDPELRGLIQRGFIVRDPSLRLMDESFRRFVLKASAAEGVSSYRGEAESHWQRLKVPMFVLLLGVVAFLFLTQKELYDTSVSMISAVTGGALALLKLIGMFQKNKGAGGAEG